MNLVGLIESSGYAVVAGLNILEGVGLPVPGELALVTAAAFAAQGHLTIAGVITASVVGTTLGGTGGYWLGRTGGLRLLDRHGHWIGLGPEKLRKARVYFDGHGVKTILISRFIAILRMVASLLAGVAHMSFPLFFGCNLLGGIVWSVAYGALGYVFGYNLPRLEHYLHEVTAIIVVLVVIAAGFLLVRRRRARASQPL